MLGTLGPQNWGLFGVHTWVTLPLVTHMPTSNTNFMVLELRIYPTSTLATTHRFSPDQIQIHSAHNLLGQVLVLYRAADDQKGLRQWFRM